MGRKDTMKKVILTAFSKSTEHSKLYSCNFCSQSYVLNVTRMSSHLQNKCIRCPREIKNEIQSKSRASSVKKIKAMNKEILERKSSWQTDLEDDDGETILSDSCPQSTASTTNSAYSEYLDFFVDVMNKSEEEEIWDLLATACFASNTPLNFTENVHWQKLFKKIKPSLRLPTRYQLSNALLDKQHSQINQLLNEKIAKSKTIGIQVDGWSNIRNESIINIIITCPEPVLFKVIDCKENHHDAAYLCSLLSSVIDDLGINKVISIVTDNASNMKSTWKLISDMYPSNYFSCYGCCAHILNLFAQDILNLEVFACLITDCEVIVKTIKKAHILQKSNALKCLKLPDQTRWSSNIFFLESLRINKKEIKELAITETIGNTLNKSIKNNILDDLFWERVDTLYKILHPVSVILKNTQTSQPCISHVVEYFQDLHDQLIDVCPVSELNAVLSHLKSRREMAVTPMHLAANFLDPKFIGKNLNNEEYITALTYINKLSMHLVSGSDIAEIMTEVAYYKSKEQLFSKDFIWQALETGKLDSVIWWKSLCCTTALSKVAIEILNSPPTICATERIFSMFIHNKKRNRLTNERAAKLVYVNLNLKLKENPALKELPTEELECSDCNTETESDLE